MKPKANLTILKRGHFISQKRVVLSLSKCQEQLRTSKTSGSIGANYIEANEAIGKKDFLMKIKTCRREAKESGYWLRLLDVDPQEESGRNLLIAEATELMKIFGAILRNSQE
jgi:four helix bundle protein